MSSSAIPPAPPPVPAPTTAAANAVLTVVAGADAKAALAALPSGSLVTVSVQALESKALMQVMTGDGTSLDLKLPPNLQLPPGADLTLQLIQQGGLPAFKLLAVNGRPFPPGPLSAGGGLGGGLLPGGGDPLLAPGLPGLAGAQPGRGAAVTLGAPTGPTVAGTPGLSGPLAGGPLGLTATVLRPAPAGTVSLPPGADTPGLPAGAQTPPPGLANLTPGTQLTVRIAGITPPGTPAVPPQATIPPAAAGAASTVPSQTAGVPPSPTGDPATPSSAQTAPPAQTSPTPAGTAPSSGAPAANTPPPPSAASFPAGSAPPPSSQPPPSSSSPPPTVTLSGTVVSHSPGGTSLVQTPAGLLSLPAGPPMPAGGTVQLEVVGPPVPPPPPTSGQQTQQGLGPGGWPALSDAADVLAQADRQAADQLIRMIPQANPRLAAAMSAFAGAVRSGDFKQLGGDSVIKGLDKAGRRDLGDRLKRDFLDLADEAQRPRGAGDWQVVTLPFAHGADIDPIHLYVHRPDPDEDKDNKAGQEQRFILEVSMSRLGRIQFDGLIQRENKRFDLIVRTGEPLGTEICRDIAGIFAECGQLTGSKGSVSFQSGRSFVELPPCDAPGTRIMV